MCSSVLLLNVQLFNIEQYCRLPGLLFIKPPHFSMQQIPFIEIAHEGKNNWWRYVVGVILTLIYMPLIFHVWYLNWVDA